MADQNPTAGPRVVPVDLQPAQTVILQAELIGWLAGLELDLAHPEPLDDREASVREADAFRRLLTAIDRSEIELPDDEAREALGKAAEGYDEASGYVRVCAVHDAHHALLS
ncbi:MAG: hypothetical protein J0H06_00655, partial [Actinobacteria bacterium]|nr:hypothetical protein [Actinomycetota bacterium]